MIQMNGFTLTRCSCLTSINEIQSPRISVFGWCMHSRIGGPWGMAVLIEKERENRSMIISTFSDSNNQCFCPQNTNKYLQQSEDHHHYCV